MAPSVTIIVPCYNGARYLEGLVASLRRLGGGYLEVILVDDGSRDGSADLFAQLMPEAQILVQENAGVAAARNAGAALARGDFLQLLDADDVILPGKLERQTDQAEREGLDVVFSDWRMAVVVGGKTSYEPATDAPMPTEPVAALLGGWWAPPHAYLIRRSAYADVGGGDASLTNAQDFDLVLRLAIAGKRFGYMRGHFADYYRYVNTSSLARGPRRQYCSDYEKAVEKAVKLLVRDGSLTQSRRKAAAQKLHSVARGVYAIDKAWFRQVVRRIYDLDPKFRASGSLLYQLLSRVAGLSVSEAVAARTRRVRAMVFEDK
jgi:glycosyltransferase involved in cell wall biosynthesis